MDRIARERIAAMDRMLAERDRRYTERFAAQEVANRLALDAANERLGRMNEFRDALTDQAATFITREEMSARMETVNAALTRLGTSEARNSGRGIGMSHLWGYIVGAAGLLIAIVGMARGFN